MKALIICGVLIGFSQVFSGCASHRTKPEVATAAPVKSLPQEATLGSLLSDNKALLESSEFSVVFPHDESPAINKITAKAEGTKYSVSSCKGKKNLKKGPLETKDYQSFIDRLRQLDESEFKESHSENCREPYTIKIKVGVRHRSFSGCRGTGQNSTRVSKLARDLEFLLIRGEVQP